MQTFAATFATNTCWIHLHNFAPFPLIWSMLKTLFTGLFLIFVHYDLFAQATLTPANPASDQEVTINFDASGTPLAGAAKVYAHAGVVTVNNGSTWQFVKGNWGKDDGVGQMTAVVGQPNRWRLVLSPTLRSYFGVPAGTNVFRLALVFRNASGSVQTSPDIFLNLSVPAFVEITTPSESELFVVAGQSFNISATISETASSATLQVNTGSGFTTISSGNNLTSINGSFTPSAAGSLQIKAVATLASSGSNVEAISTHTVVIRPPTVIASLPAGVRPGINYLADATKAVLVLTAPLKQFAYVVGDFTNWQLNNSYLMRQTPDGKFFWLELSGLTPGQEYVFQYWVDGTIKIGDPLADKVADPWNDSFIPSALYPNLPNYTRTDLGVASVLQTSQVPFQWATSESTWVRPDKRELVVYELLIRDFVGDHSYESVTDSIPYLKRMGINAIQLMPIMEFEGNISWGYNPSYFLAPDKYYGTKNALKRLIEKAHQNGMAVILDMVLNHAFGQNPYVRMYFNNATGKPTPNSPWFNQDATHPFNVGYDFNHESQYTKDLVDTVCRYWIQEYHFDGFRFDLSKGFTQTNNPNNVGAWGNYDQSRINLLTRMANKIWSYLPTAYVILEHFAAGSEETVLANNGMILWGKLTDNYSQALGGNTNADIGGSSRDSHITYMESHDEERVMVNLLNNGQNDAGYDTRNLSTALERMKLGAAFFLPARGPKMIWQFGELGYDKSIRLCPNGSFADGCRVDPKPLPWGTGGLGYYSDPERQKLYKVYGAIMDLIWRNKVVFKTGTSSFTSVGSVRYLTFNHSSMDVVIVGNFSLQYQTVNPFFPRSGTWFDYFSNSSFEVQNNAREVLFAPGEFHIYTSLKQPNQDPTVVNFLVTGVEQEFDTDALVYPNPADRQIWVKASVADKIHFVNVTAQAIEADSEEQQGSYRHCKIESLVPGIYIVEVLSDRGARHTKLLVK